MILRRRIGRMKYSAPERIVYFSPRYEKTVTVPKGYLSDGASGPASDIMSNAWWVHDVMCDTGKWDDGTPCTNWQASQVLHDILKSEGRWIRCLTWKWATFLFGGSAARKNGMFRLRRNDG